MSKILTADKNVSSEKGRLPLFYKDPVVLRFEEHGEVGITATANFGFAREAVAIPLCVSEFAIAMRHYPIVFAMEESAPPIALVGVRRDDNLFVAHDGNWHPGAYVPAYVRRYPFIATESQDRTRQFLGIDRGSDRFVAHAATHHDAERLFHVDGEASTTAQSAMAFCNAYHADHAATIAFGRALIEAKLLSPYHARFQLPDGPQHQINGFQSIDEQAFRALPANAVADWHAKGWLDLVTLQLASQRSFQNLLDLNAQRANERKALA
ncbi:SapC family protein [Shinella daejeonensis]|uniref:SapC family protein n=1 Tax=Shinella daejeonensis TaxID=659017 RepID=UPI0020C7B722|nr:SapC family protein [Shinella daejeonensis]